MLYFNFIILYFQINRDFLPSEDFIIEDLSFEGARHVLFATPDQLQHLQRARRWFIDGTFKVVSRPFYQLMSIHAFVKKDDDIKQVPLLFVLMSRRQKRDYVAVSIIISIKQKHIFIIRKVNSIIRLEHHVFLVKLCKQEKDVYILRGRIIQCKYNMIVIIRLL